MSHLKLLVAGLTLVVAAALSPAMAEDGAASVDDAQLEQFATALTDVRDLGNEYSEQIASAESQEEAQELQQEAQVEMVAAVEDTGMTVQEYNQIAEQMSQNPELMERVQAMLQ